MMLFVENKKKREVKADLKSDDHWATVEKQGLLKPAWTDKNLEKLEVNIEDKSRLRKLKQTEAESNIKGMSRVE